MKQIIQVQNISKHYELGSASNGTLREILSSFSPSKKEVFKALDNVSFEVNKGESVAIIGHNGAGKSTLLKVLSKITKPTSGRIEMEGRVTSLLEVGTGFHPELTGRENIYLNGSILGMNKAEITRKFEEIVAFSGVEKFLDTPVKHYSSGMYVRLAFSVAAHLESEILIIDEVLAVGDIEFQDKCLGKMSDITQEGKTILFVSHNLQAVAKLCNRGIVLNHGKTQYSGHINSAIQFYQNNLASGIKAENSFNQENRPGNGKFRFSGITVKNITQASSTIYSGDDIQINASIQCNKAVKANVVCRIYDSFNTRITSLTSSYFKLKIDLTDQSQISWRLPKLALTGGVYRLELAAYEDFSGLTLIDEVENALNMVVEDQDFYGFGVPQSKGRNKIYLDFTVNAS